MKRCSRCGITKDESEFYRESSRRDGYCPRCKQCERLRASKFTRSARRAGATRVEAFDPEELWERDGNTCQLCGRPIDRTLHGPDPYSPSLHHIVRIADGGAHTRDNTCWTHLSCNRKHETDAATAAASRNASLDTKRGAAGGSAGTAPPSRRVVKPVAQGEVPPLTLRNYTSGELFADNIPNMRRAGLAATTLAAAGVEVLVSDSTGRVLRRYSPDRVSPEGRRVGIFPYWVPCPQCGRPVMFPRSNRCSDCARGVRPDVAPPGEADSAGEQDETR